VDIFILLVLPFFLGRVVSGDSVFMLPFANIIIKGINPNAKHRELCLSVDQKES